MASDARESPELRYRHLPGDYAICRLPLAAAGHLPSPASGEFHCQLLAGGEWTLYCLSAAAPKHPQAQVDPGWALLELDGCFDFGVVGVLARWIAPLAAVGIPIMALASFATDYLLVKHTHLKAAQAALAAAQIRQID